MITEKRFAEILKLIKEKRVVTVLELSKILKISESTIRRDLMTLNAEGKLKKVHGGAVALEGNLAATDCDVIFRGNQYREEKKVIGRFSAKLINKNDFVFIDAGTSTEALATEITERRAVYVTNGIAIAKKLSAKKLRTIMIGGEVKPITDAVVGSEALATLKKYHFSKGFFGTNGIDLNAGYTTPDPTEAQVKAEALKNCKEAYILADTSKFGQIAPVTFGNLEDAFIITTTLKEESYKEHTKILEVTHDFYRNL